MQAGDGRPSYDELAALVVEQARVIAELRAENERLRAENGRLSARVAELERRLNRHSGNSSLPPSADVFIRPEKKAAPRGGRGRGGQPGSAGGGLAMVETPDGVDDHLPEWCGGCGAGLSLADGAGYERRQVWDIPLVSVTVTEHRAYRCRCACGVTTRAAMPVAVAGSPTSYGPNLRALAVYLLVFQHVPVERTAREGANALGVLPDFRGVVVHDSLALYDGYPDARHQLCGAHLVRELTAAAEDHPDQRWPVRVRWALAQLNKEAKKAAEQGLADIPPERALVYLQSFHHGVAVGLSLHRGLIDNGTASGGKRVPSELVNTPTSQHVFLTPAGRFAHPCRGLRTGVENRSISHKIGAGFGLASRSFGAHDTFLTGTPISTTQRLERSANRKTIPLSDALRLFVPNVAICH